MPRKPLPKKQVQVTSTDRDRLLGAMRCGMSFHRACLVNGLSPATMGRERKRNADFEVEVGKAKNALELGCLAVIRKASSKQWQAAAWLLERTDPHRYGRDRHLKGDKGGEAREVQITVVGSKHQSEFGTPATPEAPEPQVENPDG